MDKLDNLTVFFPAYNEEENIKSIVEKGLSIIPFVIIRSFQELFKLRKKLI